METFDSQRAAMLEQLEATLQPLTAFPSEDPQLLGEVVEQLRQGYEAVAERVGHHHSSTITIT